MFLCLYCLLENSKANLWPKCSQCGRPQHAFCVLTSSLVSSYFSNPIPFFFLVYFFLLFLSFVSFFHIFKLLLNPLE